MARAFKFLTAIFVVAVVTPVSVMGVTLGAYLFLPLPARLPDRSPPAASQISRVYDTAGNEIGNYRQFETSIPAAPEDIPEVLKQAVIAAEDRSFYEHGGVDVRGTIRALLNDIRNREAAQGGSTITQQLVKNTTDNGDEATIQRKIREAVLASQLDRSMDKDEILYEYISVVYLGEGAYGFPAAAQTYFRKSVRDLTLSEAATLAGLIPAPSRYSPRVDATSAETKRMLVLGAMLETGAIDEVAHAEAAQQVIWLAANGPAPGPATVVYPPETQQSSQPYFTDYVKRWLASHLPGGEDQIYRDGLRIETTLNPQQQAAAEASVSGFLDGRAADLRTSLVAVEPPTGFVRAFVSGRDFATDNVNYALGGGSAGGVGGGGSGRQPGSSFKPFVLAQALETGIPPTARYSGGPHDVREACSKDDPILENYEGGRYGSVDLRTATVKSVNTAYTRLILDVGVEATLELAQRLGLTTATYVPGDCASVALGVKSVSPLDMASAYSVFAARGMRAEPTPVLKVTDRDGNVIIDNTKPTTTRVLKEDVADNVTDILQGVLESGTAAGRGIERPAAGKTGTTQNNNDAWFIGYTPTLATAVWMGYENKTSATRKTLGNITGGSFPARIWQTFMREALEDVPITEFTEPAPIVAIADAAKLRQRKGFGPGAAKRPQDPNDQLYDEPIPEPVVEDPNIITFPDETTTTTRFGLDPDDDGGLFG
jgi:penicillin-binding protein 1A